MNERWYIQTYVLPSQATTPEHIVGAAEHPGTQYWTVGEAATAQEAWNAAQEVVLPLLRAESLRRGEHWHVEVYTPRQLRHLAYQRADRAQQPYALRWLGTTLRAISVSASSFLEAMEDGACRLDIFSASWPMVRITLQEKPKEETRKLSAQREPLRI
jgi:hypothetical protein